MKKLWLLFILMLSLSCKSSDDILPKGNKSLQPASTVGNYLILNFLVET